MTRVAIRSHVYRNNIPSKKEHGQVFYSKLHFDLSKQTAEDDSSEYYTVQEAMKKYNLTRDSVYGILQFHEIKREKKSKVNHRPSRSKSSVGMRLGSSERESW